MSVEEVNVEVFKPQELTKSSVIVKSGLRKYLEKEDVLQRLQTIQNGRDQMLMVFLWMTGVRVTEAVSLRKKDLDLKNSAIKISWLKNRKYKERVLPIKKELCVMLGIYCAKYLSEERIFPYSRQWVYALVKKYFDASPHALRHSFAVNFLRQSKTAHGLVTLKNLLGHKNINTTMEYLKIVPNDVSEELQKISFQ